MHLPCKRAPLKGFTRVLASVRKAQVPHQKKASISPRSGFPDSHSRHGGLQGQTQALFCVGWGEQGDLGTRKDGWTCRAPLQCREGLPLTPYPRTMDLPPSGGGIGRKESSPGDLACLGVSAGGFSCLNPSSGLPRRQGQEG